MTPPADPLAVAGLARSRALSPVILVTMIVSLTVYELRYHPSLPVTIWYCLVIAVIAVTTAALFLRKVPVSWRLTIAMICWFGPTSCTIVSQLFNADDPNLHLFLMIEVSAIVIVLHTKLVIGSLLAIVAIEVPLILDRAGDAARIRIVTLVALGLFAVLIHLLTKRALSTAVEAREAEAEAARELVQASDEMREVLEHMGQGFLTLSPSGDIAGARSAVVDTWLGACVPGTPIWEQLARIDPHAGFAAELGWLQLAQDVVPLEVILDMLPKRMRCGERYFDLAFRPILHAGKLARMLLVMSDATASVARERAERVNAEWGAVVGRLMADREGFLEFFQEAELLHTRILSPGDPEVLVRDLHTLKGNCALFGLSSIASMCHELETDLQESDVYLAREKLAALHHAWEAVAKPLRQLLDHQDTRTIELPAEEHADFLAKLRRGVAHDRLLAIAASWANEPVERKLRRIADGAAVLATRLGKRDLRIEIETNELRLPPDCMRSFWGALVHVVRNAVDHGIEGAEERRAVGKPTAGRLSLTAALDGDDLVVEVVDDGRGIAWDRIAAKARERGLPARTHRDLHAALFVDGLSTRDEASETSGRGVGLSALRAACIEQGGRVEVTSTLGEGTYVRCTMPLTANVRARVAV